LRIQKGRIRPRSALIAVGEKLEYTGSNSKILISPPVCRSIRGGGIERSSSVGRSYEISSRLASCGHRTCLEILAQYFCFAILTSIDCTLKEVTASTDDRAPARRARRLDAGTRVDMQGLACAGPYPGVAGDVVARSGRRHFADSTAVGRVGWTGGEASPLLPKARAPEQESVI